MSVANLIRPDIRALKGYQAAAFEPDCVRLNANESHWRMISDRTERGLNRYPPARPFELRDRLAELYDVPAATLAVTRGSSEGIDLLIRAFCRAGRDSVLICPPTFGMYQVYAGIQGASILEVPLVKERGFALDVDGVCAALNAGTKLIFICRPNNPTGTPIDSQDVAAVVESARNRAVVVIDEAYRDFSAQNDSTGLRTNDHVVLLRTLSKASALAGLRCGTIIADETVIEAIDKVSPPYNMPTPSVELALAALTPDALEDSRNRVSAIVSERSRLEKALAGCESIIRVWPSEGNFLMVEAVDAPATARRAREGGILIRRFPGTPGLENSLRITIGDAADNDRLLEILGVR